MEMEDKVQGVREEIMKTEDFRKMSHEDLLL